MSSRTFSTTLACAIVLAASPLLAEDDWDSDGDGMISEAEYDGDDFAKYDINGDGKIDSEEREAFDADRDNDDNDEDDDIDDDDDNEDNDND